MRGGASIAKRAGETGMTLVEMLVVLAIIGVTAGAVTLGIGAATRAPTVETEARRLATRLQAASDDALLGDRVLAFTGDAHGYGFAVHDGRRLMPASGEALAYHRLPGGMALKLSTRQPLILGAMDAPMVATLQSGSQHWQVVFDGLTARAAPVPAA